jgi:FdrA protein
MIDPRVRTDMILQAGAAPEVGVLLLDLVLGRGSHENPAEPLASAVKEARRTAERDGRRIAFLASIVGTALDPQDMAFQAAQMEEAGIDIFATNADAARYAALLVMPELQEKWREGEAHRTVQALCEAAAGGGESATDLALPGEPLRVINIGLESFADDLRSQGVEAVHVDWRPPACDNARLASLLTSLDDED